MKKKKIEYAIIDREIVNQDCEVICRLGRTIAEVSMSGSIEDELKKVFPGCRVRNFIGRARYPSELILPGCRPIMMECVESPIKGEWENGWTVQIWLH
jgi:hypothetical protein